MNVPNARFSLVYSAALVVTVFSVAYAIAQPLFISAQSQGPCEGAGYEWNPDQWGGICGGEGGGPAVLTLIATPGTIPLGSSSLLSWGWTRDGASIPTPPVQDCSIDRGVGSVAPAGTRSVSPVATTTYTITCLYYYGGPWPYEFSASDTVTVTSAVSVPTASLSAAPSSVNSGGSSTLYWTSTGATSCAGTNFSTGGATSGSVSTGVLTANRSYSVTCTGPGGSAMSSASVVVLSSGGVCTPGQPTTKSYSAGWDYLQSEEGCDRDLHERQQYLYEIRSIGSNQYQVWQIDDIYERQANCDTNNIYTANSNDVLVDTITSPVAPTGTIQSVGGGCQGGGGDSYVCSSSDSYVVSYTCPSTVPPPPSGLQYSCNGGGTQATLSWTPGAGATQSYFRFDDPTNNSGSCTDGWFCADPPDKALTTPQTSATVSIVPNRSYSWWVHSGNSVGDASAPTSAGFSCPAAASLSCSVSNQGPAVGQSVRFTASGGSPSYTWTFSEGGSQTTSTTYLDRTYTTAGTYTVTLSKSGMTSDTCPLVTVGAGSCTDADIDVTTNTPRVKKGNAGALSWNIPKVSSGVTSCTLTSSANPSWSHIIPIGTCATGSVGTVATHPLTTQTTFTLTCGTKTDIVVVNILPVIDEI